MSPARRYDARKVRRALRTVGVEFVRAGKGSHEIYRTPSGQPISLPLGHPSGIAEGTLRSTLEKAGIRWDTFKKEL